MTHVLTGKATGKEPTRGIVPEPAPVAAAARTGRRWRRLLPVLVVALIAVLGVFVIEPVTVGSASMSPTIHSGDRILIDKATYHFRDPRVGEIVAFHAPRSGELTVKRVVGVAGDRVALRDGVLWVDGAAVHESYVDHAMVDSVYFGPTTVPAGTVFVMGDNRGESIDSRIYGAVPQADVVGRVIRMWSL